MIFLHHIADEAHAQEVVVCMWVCMVNLGRKESVHHSDIEEAIIGMLEYLANKLEYRGGLHIVSAYWPSVLEVAMAMITEHWRLESGSYLDADAYT